jgi:hypothetical protein
VNAQWLGDILLGNLEALRPIQYSRYTAFNLQDPFAPTQHLVLSLLGKRAPGAVHPAEMGVRPASATCLLTPIPCLALVL